MRGRHDRLGGAVFSTPAYAQVSTRQGHRPMLRYPFDRATFLVPHEGSSENVQARSAGGGAQRNTWVSLGGLLSSAWDTFFLSVCALAMRIVPSNLGFGHSS